MTAAGRLATAASPAAAVAGSRALLTVGNPSALTAADTSIRDRLKSLGFTVDLVDDSKVAPNTTPYRVIVHAPSSHRSNLSTKYDASLAAVVAFGGQSWPHSKFVPAGVNPTAPGGQVQFSVAAPTHALVAARGSVGPLSGTVPYATGGSTLLYVSATLLGTGPVKVLQQRSDQTDRATGVAFERGARLSDNTTRAASRRVWLGYCSTPSLLNAAGWLVFDNAVMWGATSFAHGEQITAASVGCTTPEAGLTALAVSGGRYTVSTANTVLDKVWIPGELMFSAEGCTVKNSRIRNSVTGNTSVAPTFTVEDCDVGYNKNGSAPTANRGSEGIRHHHYTARRCRVGGFADAVRISGAVTVEDCFLRVRRQATGDHNDVSQNYGGQTAVNIRRCNMDARPTNISGQYGNACFQETDPVGGTQTFEDNLFAGGAYGLNIPGAGVPYVFRRNKFVRGSFQYGTHRIGAETVTWANTGSDVNTYSDNGEVIPR